MHNHGNTRSERNSGSDAGLLGGGEVVNLGIKGRLLSALSTNHQMLQCVDIDEQCIVHLILCLEV